MKVFAWLDFRRDRLAVYAELGRRDDGTRFFLCRDSDGQERLMEVAPECEPPLFVSIPRLMIEPLVAALQSGGVTDELVTLESWQDLVAVADRLLAGAAVKG